MRKLEQEVTATSTVRMSYADAHYGGNLVDGAHIVHLFGDVATELAVIYDGDEGLLLRYNYIDFWEPVFAGDYIRVDGRITEVGNTSRKMELIAYKTAIPRPDINPSAVDHLEDPVIVARGELIGVTKRELMRIHHE